MNLNDLTVSKSFGYLSFTREALHDALRSMCPAALKAYDTPTTIAMRVAWSPQRPTRFCCYFVSEMIYWYQSPIGSDAMALSVPGDGTLHRFVRWSDGIIVDVTCDQFDQALDYRFMTRRMFMQTGARGPSKRAQQLAALLGLRELTHPLT